MGTEDDRPAPQDLVPRDPTVEDLVDLCRHLNAEGAKYLIVGGFAMRAAGLRRSTMDIDVMLDTSLENETRVFKALESLPDKAVRELQQGDMTRSNVIRVADEIVVDLMRSACGIDYAEASKEIVYQDVHGVKIPFASPRLLWRMKKPTNRAKDVPDLYFLLQWFEANGQKPPDVD